MTGAADRLRQAQLPPRGQRRNGTLTRAARHHRPEPRLPHEHDESSDSQRRGRDERVEQAARDVERGLVDTGPTPVIEELARKHFPAPRRHDAKRR
jgi:hypothetical protein